MPVIVADRFLVLLYTKSVVFRKMLNYRTFKTLTCLEFISLLGIDFLIKGPGLDRGGGEAHADFAAEHADISTGGIGNETDWTLTIVRTELGRAVIDAMVKDGAIETRPGDDDPGAIVLMHRLAENSRKRWPDWAQPAAKVGISAKPAG